MKNIANSRDTQLNIAGKKLEFFEDKCTLLEQENEELKAKVKYYEEQFRLSQSQKFGASSEKTDPEQLSVFNEAEKESRETIEEPTVRKRTP